jgi:hypothetical protein
MLVILVLFFVTTSRLVFTVLFRVIVIGKAKGCGFYLFGALLGCVYQLIISPLKWADNAAQSMAKRVELGLIEGAEDNAAASDGDRGDDCGGHNGAANGHYPDLNEARNRERRYLNWGPWYRRGITVCLKTIRLYRMCHRSKKGSHRTTVPAPQQKTKRHFNTSSLITFSYPLQFYY